MLYEVITTLSLVEIIITLYFRIMHIKPDNPRWEDRDRFILSKGHAGPTLYTALAYKGYMSKDVLLTLNANGTKLPSHVDQVITPGVDQTAARWVRACRVRWESPWRTDCARKPIVFSASLVTRNNFV